MLENHILKSHEHTQKAHLLHAHTAAIYTVKCIYFSYLHCNSYFYFSTLLLYCEPIYCESTTVEEPRKTSISRFLNVCTFKKQ